MATGRIADGLLRRAVARLPIRLEYPDGSVIGAADPTLPTMVIHQPKALAAASAGTGSSVSASRTWRANGSPTIWPA